MPITDKNIQTAKEILEKDNGREFTEDEVRDTLADLKMLAGLAVKSAIEKVKMEKLLDESPKGFHYEGGICLICGSTNSKENSWFDKNGLKCMKCQKAIDSKVILGSIAKNKESWYSGIELELFFNLKNTDLKRLINLSILKARTIPGKGKKPHFQVFLIKENKDVLPPKNLIKSRITQIKKDGQEFYTHQYWFDYVDQKLFNKLKRYKITEYFKETFARPTREGAFNFKSINPLFF
jgi:hypothetical protein